MEERRQHQQLVVGITSYPNGITTEPVPEGATIPALVEALGWFQVRPAVAERFHRALETVIEHSRLWRSGREGSGRRWKEFVKGVEAQLDLGKSRAEALQFIRKRTLDDVRSRVEAALPCWAPHRLQSGERRSPEAVSELHALVLEWRDGPLPEDVGAEWATWFHVVSSTWEHTEERPTFRLVLPFANPVPASQWPSVTRWAREQAPDAFVAENPAAVWSLPVVGAPDAPRFFDANAGAFLNLEELEVVRGVVSDWPEPSASSSPPSLLRPDPEVPRVRADDNEDKEECELSDNAKEPDSDSEQTRDPRPATRDLFRWLAVVARIVDALRQAGEDDPALLLELLEQASADDALNERQKALAVELLLGGSDEG